MSLSEAAAYGELMAPVYDDFFPTCDAAAIDLLVELAGGGAALELGIGTGRVALPLAARRIAVHGIDASPAMVERLYAKLRFTPHDPSLPRADPLCLAVGAGPDGATGRPATAAPPVRIATRAVHRRQQAEHFRLRALRPTHALRAYPGRKGLKMGKTPGGHGGS